MLPKERGLHLLFSFKGKICVILQNDTIYKLALRVLNYSGQLKGHFPQMTQYE